MKTKFYSLLFLLSCVLLSCSRNNEIIVTNSIGGFYFFINVTTADSIDNYDADKDIALKAHNGDSLCLMYKSVVPKSEDKNELHPYKCRTTFVLHDGSKHIIEDTNDKNMQYGFVLQNTSPGRKTFLAFSEIIDRKVRYTGNENIIVFKLLVE